jgi:hypothetical protein
VQDLPTQIDELRRMSIETAPASDAATTVTAAAASSSSSTRAAASSAASSSAAAPATHRQPEQLGRASGTMHVAAKGERRGRGRGRGGKKGVGQATTQPLQEGAAGAGSIGHSASSGAKAGVQAIRERCKNTLAAAAVVLSTPSVLDDARIMVTVHQPIREFHGHVVMELAAGPRQTQQFFAQQAAGAWLRPLCDVVSVPADPSCLQSCGLQVELRFLQDSDDAQQLRQEFLAQRVDSLVFHRYI